MRSMRGYLTDIFAQAFQNLGFDRVFGLVTDSSRPDLGQFQCNGALAAARTKAQAPRELAVLLMEDVRARTPELLLSMAGAGFINITLEPAFLAQCTNALSDAPRFGIPFTAQPRKFILDFGGPNVAKPMHVGHLRSAIIGDALQRLLKFTGEQVITDNHLGDWGTQMGMLICELRRRQPHLPYFEPQFQGAFPDCPPVDITQLEEMYPQASALCKRDEEALKEALQATLELQQGRPGFVALWRHFVQLSVAALTQDFNTLSIHFDHWLGESFYQERMAALVANLKKDGQAVLSAGAWILPIDEVEDKEEYPPLLLQKSDGAYLYGTSDLATIQERIIRFQAEEILYVVDKRQHLHFQQVFRAARKLKIVTPATVLGHVGFGTMNGLDGKPFKTRQGGVMKLADLVVLVNHKAKERMQEAGIARDFSLTEQEDIIRKVGLATLKFADLSNHRETDYVFDIDKFTRFDGKTGPYLLYTAVRIKSILRNAQQKGIQPGTVIKPRQAEIQLMLQLCSITDVLTAARAALLPSYLCDFAYALAQEFNRFYKECHILAEKDPDRQASWLSLAKLVLAELELVLGLLGIEIPERM